MQLSKNRNTSGFVKDNSQKEQKKYPKPLFKNFKQHLLYKCETSNIQRASAWDRDASCMSLVHPSLILDYGLILGCAQSCIQANTFSFFMSFHNPFYTELVRNHLLSDTSHCLSNSSSDPLSLICNIWPKVIILKRSR